MSKFKFKSWDDKPEIGEELKISEPPCKHCAYWKPQYKFDQNIEGFRFKGVRLCWKDGSLFNDFSCFKAKEEIK